MSETKVQGMPLKVAADSLYLALPTMQKRVVGAHGAKDLSVEVVVGDVHDQTVFTDQRNAGAHSMRLTVCLHHLDGIGDVASSTFRACTYALYAVLREQMRHASVLERGKRIVAQGTDLEATMPIGESDLLMRLEVL